jgi:hypothetical protein
VPRYYPSGKRCQLNLTLDADAFQILETLAPSKRAYGHLLSQMLRDLVRSREEKQLSERIEALEEKLQTA